LLPSMAPSAPCIKACPCGALHKGAGGSVQVDYDVCSGHGACQEVCPYQAIDLEELEDGLVRRRFETTRPLPTYLLAFAVGPYDLVEYGMIPPNDVRDRDVPLRAIAAKGQGKNLKYALEHTPGILTALEEFFGTPYPYRKLDLIAVPTSFGGAMENAGAITYDEYLLLMDESAALDQRRAYAAVHAHELGHMWFGDLVTPKWWNDLWLNESFATWMAYEIIDAWRPEWQIWSDFAHRRESALTVDAQELDRQLSEELVGVNQPMERLGQDGYQFAGRGIDVGDRVRPVRILLVGEQSRASVHRNQFQLIQHGGQRRFRVHAFAQT